MSTEMIRPDVAGKNGDIMRLSVFLEQKPGAGEDAEPTIIVSGSRGLLAVFDGMGGAGGGIVKDPKGCNRTAAYCASRLAKEVVEGWFAELYDSASASAGPSQRGDEIADALRARLVQGFREGMQALEIAPSRLKSALLRPLPTTMAAIQFDRIGPFQKAPDAATESPSSVAELQGTVVQLQDSKIQCHALWAGDSRAYVLRQDAGLQQLSKDDVKSGGDAFENLTDDSPLSNCISADGDFTLNRATASIAAPAILIVATDGCFGFVSTPAHFEHLILASLSDSSDLNSWRANLEGQLKAIAGDDASLAMAAIGWQGFAEMQSAFAERLRYIEHDLISEVRTVEAEIRSTGEKWEEINRAYEKLKARRQELREKVWRSYKGQYEGLQAQSEGA